MLGWPPNTNSFTGSSSQTGTTGTGSNSQSAYISATSFSTGSGCQGENRDTGTSIGCTVDDD